jgi:hypothetical protein
MKNLNRLGFLATIGTMAAFSFSIGACSDDPESTGGTAGTGATAGTGGTPGASGSKNTGGGGAATGGGGAATGGGGAATGGGGAATGGGGMATGGGGAATGGGGAATGGGGAATGGGGAGGNGGAGGSGGSGGGGGAPSADCSKWCSGANGLIAQCAGKLAPAVDTEAKCIANCTKPPATGNKGLSCWNMHLGFIVGGQDKTTHCPHASGADGNGQCNETE